MARRNISAGSMPVGISPEEILPEAEQALDAEHEEQIARSFDEAAPADKNFVIQQVTKVLAGIKGFTGLVPDQNAKKLQTQIKPPAQALLKAGDKPVTVYFSGRGKIGSVYHSKFVSFIGAGKHLGVPESVATKLQTDHPESFKVL